MKHIAKCNKIIIIILSKPCKITYLKLSKKIISKIEKIYITELLGHQIYILKFSPKGPYALGMLD